jgi:hypothetical protein
MILTPAQPLRERTSSTDTDWIYMSLYCHHHHQGAPGSGSQRSEVVLDLSAAQFEVDGVLRLESVTLANVRNTSPVKPAVTLSGNRDGNGILYGVDVTFRDNVWALDANGGQSLSYCR